MGYRSLNNLVACVPFGAHGIQKKVAASGLVMAENYQALTPLKVVADGPPGSGIYEGDTAFVSGRLNNQPWAKEVLERPDGAKFILIPVQHISMVETTSIPPPPVPCRPDPTSVAGPGEKAAQP